ncbi:MAG: hypothetical protein IJX90_06995 [Blautia sp.]|nr:hypothetical protein [Blautia sp.]
MKEWLKRFFAGDLDPLEGLADGAEERDSTREELKIQRKEFREEVYRRAYMRSLDETRQKGFYAFYSAIAVISCVLLIGVLLFTVANLPEYGEENPRTVEVVERYVEKGVEETGAVNIVAGMILDYRAFDTLGESHVLFTALVCVMILLRIDKKNMRTDMEDYYTIRDDVYFDISGDSIMRRVGSVILPCIILFGVYILLNGQNGPGGGFSGGAIMGAALIIFSTAFGFKAVDRILTTKVLMIITFVSLSFYSFAKGYVFFTGANGLENHIPKGTPGAILSGGLILPLDIAVGLVVACTMYGFYSLFKRGSIGHD